MTLGRHLPGASIDPRPIRLGSRAGDYPVTMYQVANHSGMVTMHAA